MPWFFTDREIDADKYIIEGETARHMLKSLRMKQGEELTRKTCENEPDVKITLYQALPKGDKMDYIVQKCVELGISEIVPVISARCVSRPDEKSLRKKLLRWQKIALEAAQQSRRGIIPKIGAALSFRQAVEKSKENELNIFFYELGGESVAQILTDKPKTIGFFIGSEGGFEEKEAQLAAEAGAKTATLGKRILRAETAPLAALSVIMYQTGNFD